jgi:S-layer protein
MAVPITSTMQNQIAQNYIAILGRNPEAGGFNFWVNTYADAGGTPAALTSITNGFGNSAEFRGTYGGLSTEAAIALMYQNVLLRAADAGGLAYWTGIANNLIAKGETISNAYAQTGAQMIYTASSNGSSDSAGINARTAAAVAAGQTAPATTYTLTTGIDTFGNAGSTTQIFNAADGTFTSLDALTGGTSTADRLNIASTAAFTANPAGVSVTNIENVNFSLGAGGTITTAAGSGFTGVTNLGVTSAGNLASVTAAATTAITVNSTSGANPLAINGGSSVNLTATATTLGNVTVGGTATTNPTGAVTVSLANTVSSAAAAVVGSTVTITGGSIVNVTSTLTNTSNDATAGRTATAGAIGVTGTANTTSVTVTQTGSATQATAADAVAGTSNALAARNSIVNSAVTIADANAGSAANAGTITTVTLANYGASTISSSGLTTLNLSNSTATGAIAAGTLGITYGLTTGNPTALALNLGGGSLGAITTGTTLTTINATLTANTTLAGVTNTGLRTLAVSGTGVLTVTMNTAVTSVTTAGAAGIAADLSGNVGITAISLAGSGNNTVTINSVLQAYAGGAGNDVVTITADALKAISGGAGTNTIVLNGANTTFLAANTGANVTGFTTLGLNTLSTGTFALGTVGLTGINTVTLLADAGAGNAAGVSGITVGTALNINAAQTGTFTYQIAGTSAATSAATVNMNITGGDTGFGRLDFQDTLVNGIGTLNFVSTNSIANSRNTITTLTSSQLNTLNLSGNATYTVTNAIVTGATSFALANTVTSRATDAALIGQITGATMGALNYSGTRDTTITVLDTGTTAINVITNANTATTAGTGVLTIGGHTNAALNSLTLNGAIALTGVYALNGAASVSGATNNAAVTLTMDQGGAKTVVLGNGNNTITTGAAIDTITVGTGRNIITGGALADAITLGAGHTTVNRLNLNAVATTSSDSTQVVVAGNGNDTGADVYTNVNLSTDVFRVISTAIVGFNATTNTVIGTAGATADGTAASFTANTGLVYLDGSNATFTAGELAITFVNPSATLTAANFRAMVQYDLTTTAGDSANVVVTGTLNDVVRATTQTNTFFDTFTGGAGSDVFSFATRANGLNAAAGGNITTTFMDRVTDFVVGSDIFNIGTGAAAFGTQTFTAATVVSLNTIAVASADVADFAGIATAANGVLAGAASTATTAQIYIVTTGTIGTATAFSNKVYLVVNDATAAIAATDTWIDITGVTGTITTAQFTFGTGSFIA